MISSYCNSRLEGKTLIKCMSKLNENVGLSQTYANHSIRATGATLCMFSPSQIVEVTGHKSIQSLTVYQRTDMDEKIAMGQTMGQNLTNDLGENIPALPSTSQLALPPPQDTNESSLVPFVQDNGSTIAELQGINIGDLFSDFESQTTVAAASVQTKHFMDAPLVP